MKKLILLFSLVSLVPKNNVIGYCDIKGNVNNPGVYEIKENQTIQDIINDAGGLKDSSYTDNINLSKTVTDEMVIYIHSNIEIEKIKELQNCDCSPIYKYKECKMEETTTTITQSTQNETIYETTTQMTNTINKNTTQKTTTTNISTIQTTTTNESDKININRCTIEDLIKLKGLGESKARSIIDYRNNNGLFNTIEDLLKVNGIGNKTFENIKDFIEV